MYVEQNKSVQSDFYCFNEDMWKFLFERYGGQVIKRFYTRSSSSYTNVESKLKAITLRLLNSEELTQSFDDAMIKSWWTQVNKAAGIKELKKRVVDILNGAGYMVESEDVRMWLYQTNE